MLSYVSKECSAFIFKHQAVQEQTWTTLPLKMKVLHLVRMLQTLTQQHRFTSQGTRILNSTVAVILDLCDYTF